MILARPFLSLASPAGSRGRLSVLVLHRVLAEHDPIFPEALDANRFAAMCRWLRSMFNVLPLDEAARRLRTGGLPARALAITFDDGYADNAHVAMPVLRDAGLSATVFVTTDYLNGGCMWNDRIIEAVRRSPLDSVDVGEFVPGIGRMSLRKPLQRRHLLESVIDAVKYLPPNDRLERVARIERQLRAGVATSPMMTTADVVALHRAGMQVGAHTRSHPILTTLDDATLHDELDGSRAVLEQMIDARVGLFAYPNGKRGDDYDDRCVAAVRAAGFDAAVTTERGAARAGGDPYQIPRFTPWDRTPMRFALRMTQTLLRSPSPAH